MTKTNRLFLDLNKSSIGTVRAGGEGQEKRWTRFPGAASMFNARDAEARETQRLMTQMPTPKLAISDGNFTSADDVVKGLGFAPNDETLWAHRVARMVSRAPNELALRKAVVADLRSETLEPTLRSELNRRILSLYRQRAGGKPLEKAFPPKKDDGGKPSFPPAKGKPPGGKPMMGARPGQGGDADAASRNPAVDGAELTEQPDDKALLQNKIHALHEELRECQGPITGNAALIHMHNDIKAQMRDAYRDPHPEVVADIDHKVHHFKKFLEGPPEPEVDPNDPNAQPGDAGKPGAGGFGGREAPPKPGKMAGPPAGKPAGRQPGKRPNGPPMMGKSLAGGPPSPFELGRRGIAAAAFYDFVKGAGHKYLRRLPTGKAKPRYRYIYDAQKAVDTKARPSVGEKIKVTHNGQAGHYEVKRTFRDGRVEVTHDETGHRMVLHRSKLHNLVKDVHAPVDQALENQRLDEKHRKVDMLPRSRQAVLDAIKEASGINDHDLAAADAAYAAWKGRGRKGPKPQRPGKAGGELDSFSADLKRGKHFSSLLEAFEAATKGAKTWRDIAPVIQQLREVPGFENAHLPEDALLRHAMQDEERRTAPDSRQIDPEKYGETVGKHVDEQGFDWSTGEQANALATDGDRKSLAKRQRAAKKAAKLAESRPTPAVADDEPRAPLDPDAPDAEKEPDEGGGDADSFDFGANVDDDERGSEMRRSYVNLVVDLRKSLGGTTANHKYIRRTPRPGGGYDYVYADQPHAKEHLKAAPIGSQLEIEHNGKMATYVKTGRDDWQGAAGGVIASGWFVGKPGTFTHGKPHPEPDAASVDPGLWRAQPTFGVAGGPVEHVLTPAGAARAMQVGAQLNAAAAAALADLAGGSQAIEKRTGSKVDLTDFGKEHGTALSDLTSRGLAELHTGPDGRSYSLTVAGKDALARGHDEQRRLLDRVKRAHPEPAAAAPKPEEKPAPKAKSKPAQQGFDFGAPTTPTAIQEATAEAAKQPAAGAAVEIPRTAKGKLDLEHFEKLGADFGRVAAPEGTMEIPDAHPAMRELLAAMPDTDERIAAMKAWYRGHAKTAGARIARETLDEIQADSPMAEAVKEAEKQPAIEEPAERPDNFDTMPDADDAAGAWKVEPYDDAAEDAKEREAVARNQERIESAKRHLEKTKEEVAAKEGTRQAKTAAEWLRQAQEGYDDALKVAERGLATRAARRAAKKEAAERHAAEAPERVKLAREARARLAAAAEKAKPKKPVEIDTKKVNRQRAREIGEHVPDSAKDRADERALLTKGDLDALSFSEAHRLVNKRNAMPVYSLDQFKARGASPGAAHLGLAMANLVAPSPTEDSDSARRAYLDGIRLVHGIMDRANTVDDYYAAVRELNDIADARFGGGRPIAVIQKARKLTSEEKSAAREAGTFTSSDYEGIDIPPGNYAREVLTPRVQRENPDLAVASRYNEGGIEFYTYSKSEKNEIREAVNALGKRFSDQIIGGAGKIWNDAIAQARTAEAKGVAGWDHLEQSGEAKAAKKAAAKEQLESQESGSGKETKLRWRQPIADRPAVINPTVNITSANPERLVATFGLRSGQPGQSIPDAELAHHHKYAEMAFHDLANVLGIEPKHVSMNGRLAIAIAARGKGRAMAHYEPEKKVINITRFAGAGTIAHEWGHFMDNIVAEQHRGSSTKGRVYGSAGDHGNMAPELRSAFKAFDAALRTPNPETVRKIQKDHDKRYAEATAMVTTLRNHPGRRFSASAEDKADYKRLNEIHNNNLDKIALQKKFLAAPTSDYMMISVAHDGGKEGKYWSEPQEMFARAFESYVQEKIEGAGRRNSYLVDGTRETGDPFNDDAMPYPRKDELAKIHGAVEGIIAAMRNGGHFAKAHKALWSSPLRARRRGPKLVIAA